MDSTTQATSLEDRLKTSRQASYVMATLTTDQKNQALTTLAHLIETHTDALVTANKQDLDAQTGHISSAMLQRLKWDAGKLAQVVQGLRDVVSLPDPVGTEQLKTQLDDGLILRRVAVPIGVIAIVFESRPDVLPQIVSLILKSGNAVVFKGGQEAQHSNHAMMTLIQQLTQTCAFLPDGWCQLLESRQAFQELLQFHQYVDLVIPRGSNALVQMVMASTKIPVLGHADGVCHMWVDATADITKAVDLILDAKGQYPSACNALETLLVHADMAGTLLPKLNAAIASLGWTLKGCERTQAIIPCEPATEDDWRTEYGELTLSIKVLDSLEQAIEHINTYGSHHTDVIVSQDEATIARFMGNVDSASVFANASSRFADGFRYGFGAEIGISTAKTHARGPVGMDGLVIYQYQVTGQYHTVAPYVGEDAKPFQHRRL